MIMSSALLLLGVILSFAASSSSSVTILPVGGPPLVLFHGSVKTLWGVGGGGASSPNTTLVVSIYQRGVLLASSRRAPFLDGGVFALTVASSSTHPSTACGAVALASVVSNGVLSVAASGVSLCQAAAGPATPVRRSSAWRQRVGNAAPAAPARGPAPSPARRPTFSSALSFTISQSTPSTVLGGGEALESSGAFDDLVSPPEPFICVNRSVWVAPLPATAASHSRTSALAAATAAAAAAALVASCAFCWLVPRSSGASQRELAASVRALHALQCRLAEAVRLREQRPPPPVPPAPAEAPAPARSALSAAQLERVAKLRAALGQFIKMRRRIEACVGAEGALALLGQPAAGP